MLLVPFVAKCVPLPVARWTFGCLNALEIQSSSFHCLGLQVCDRVFHCVQYCVGL